MSMENEVNHRIRAVQYLRMSTDHQRFSLDAQRAAIGEYADQRGYEIVGTYADPGKSGLSLKGRDALRSLLSDVLSPQRDFDAILILDVSRWGRFQDPDQAAHYEFICRQAGLEVIYCGEPFDNDASPMSNIVKNLKRVMAHEYIRELSARLSRAHLQQASLGLKQGGPTIYGFRRLLLDDHGTPKFILKKGELKAIRTDRVCFTLGTPAEQEVIRQIFHLYVHQEYSLKRLAKHLNGQGIPGNGGKPWTSHTVRSLLTSELNVGVYTYNRTTQKLHTPPRVNPEHLWVRAAARIESLISDELFAAAQARLARCKSIRLDDDYLLDGLRRVWERNGRLSISIVNASPDVPSSATYKQHFGTFTEALRRIEYVKPLCFFGGPSGRVWTLENLRIDLRRLYAQHGFLSMALIEADPALPSYSTVQKKIGSLPALYEFAGLPPKNHDEIIKEARARHKERLRGVPQRRPGDKNGNWSDEGMIRALKRLLKRTGYLSGPLITKDPRSPSTSTLITRFGSLLRAYNAAGWAVDVRQISKLKYARSRPTRARARQAGRMAGKLHRGANPDWHQPRS